MDNPRLTSLDVIQYRSHVKLITINNSSILYSTIISLSYSKALYTENKVKMVSGAHKSTQAHSIDINAG